MSQQDSYSASKSSQKFRLDRSLSIAKDDPFLNLLVKSKSKNDLSVEEQIEQYFPDFNGTNRLHDTK